MSTQLIVGWLLLAAAVLVFVGGFGVRAAVGRRRDHPLVQRLFGGMRRTAVGRLLFGPVVADALDDQELDEMILMPAITVSCGLCLTAIFLLGWVILT